MDEGNGELDEYDSSYFKAEKTFNATMNLISSLSCPPSCYDLATRIMSSNIGARRQKSQDSFHNLTFLMRNIRRTLERKYNLEGRSRTIQISSEFQKKNIHKSLTKQQINQVMQKVQLLFGTLEYKYKTEKLLDEVHSVKWLIFLSKLVVTASNSAISTKLHSQQKQIKNLKLLQNPILPLRSHSLKGTISQPEMHKKKTNQSRKLHEIERLDQDIYQQPSSVNKKGKENFIMNQYNLLLRDCFFALQGIDGEMVRFLCKHHGSGPVINSQSQYPYFHEQGLHIRPGILSNISSNPNVIEEAIRICGECGWLYLRIQSYTKNSQNDSSALTKLDRIGIVRRAFSAALNKELGGYHHLLAMLESKLKKNVEKMKHPKIRNHQPFTFRRLLVWLSEPTFRLQVLATITDGVQSLRGGQLADALHLHAKSHGDPMIQDLLYEIVATSTTPIYRMMKNWVLEGLLPNDPHDEFFIVQRVKKSNGIQDNKHRRKINKQTRKYHSNDIDNDDNIWDGKYYLNATMIPRFIGEELAQEALLVGKGINFIRVYLDEPSWRLCLNESSVSESPGSTFCLKDNVETSFRYGNEYKLLQTLLHASSQINSHILKSLIGRQHRLIDHLHGIKRILLLGQGDFVVTLLDGLQFELNKPSNRVYIHTLNAIFDNAIRSTNARYLPPHVLEKFRVKLLKKTNTFLFSDNDSRDDKLPKDSLRQHEDVGWDIFSLDYNLEAPLSAIIHSRARQKYRRIFHLLWKMKQIEWALNKSWKQANALNHALWQYLGKYNTTNRKKISGKSAMLLLNQAATTRQAMLHFISNLQSYLLFEVVEGGWKSLLQSVQKAKSLNEVIEAHDNYLSNITKKSLLDRRSSGLIAFQLAAVFNKCSEFCSWQESAFNMAEKALQHTRTKQNEVEQRSANGLWGYELQEWDTDSDVEFFRALSDAEKATAVNKISKEFSAAIKDLLFVLHNKINSTPLNEHDKQHVACKKLDEKMNIIWEYKKKKIQIEGLSSVYDVDSALRFLAFQLDFNEFYERKGKNA